MIEYVVVDVQAGKTEANSKAVMARSPEQAAKMALGLDLIRSGSKQNLRARVYSQVTGQTTSMVRLYVRIGDQAEKGQEMPAKSSADQSAKDASLRGLCSSSMKIKSISVHPDEHLVFRASITWVRNDSTLLIDNLEGTISLPSSARWAGEEAFLAALHASLAMALLRQSASKSRKLNIKQEEYFSAIQEWDGGFSLN